MVLTKTPDPKMVRLQQELGATYTIVERIGSGGMGEVYLANHKTLGGKWAIKVLADELARDSEVVERFIREAQIEANLQHPNIVKVFDISTRGDFQFLVMPFVEGENLNERMKRLGTMDPVEAVTIVQYVTRALECAHENSIIHRDLKPSNIRIDHYGTVIVMDFGIARVLDAGQGKTALGSRIGTPQYMSPEQSAGRPVDHRSDLYSLGVILYEMISGENPFLAENPFATGVKHLTLVPPKLSTVKSELPSGFSEVVEKLLSKEPGDRFQTAKILLEALEPYGGSVEIRTPMPKTKQERSGELSVDSLLRLGALEAVLCRIPEPENTRKLTADEEAVYSLTDGVATVREILERTSIDAEAAASAIESLQKDGFIYTEMPAYPSPGGIPPTVLPPTKLPGGAAQTGPQPSSGVSGIQPGGGYPSQPGAQTGLPAEQKGPVSGTAADRAEKRTGKKSAVIWIVAIAAVLIIAGAGVYFRPVLFPLQPVMVQIDASPFAKATIKSDKNEVLYTEDTPFVKELKPGTYTFEFVNGPLSRTETVKIDEQSSNVIRVDFWSEEQTQSLIEAHRKSYLEKQELENKEEANEEVDNDASTPE